MISNLRAALDHIIWALVEESGNAAHDNLTFPCVPVPGDGNKRVVPGSCSTGTAAWRCRGSTFVRSQAGLGGISLTIRARPRRLPVMGRTPGRPR